jgi:hypothetical protein
VNVDDFLGRLPSADEIRERLGQNLRERAQLRRLLKLAEDRRSSQIKEPTEGERPT